MHKLFGSLCVAAGLCAEMPAHADEDLPPEMLVVAPTDFAEVCKPFVSSQDGQQHFLVTQVGHNGQMIKCRNAELSPFWFWCPPHKEARIENPLVNNEPAFIWQPINSGEAAARWQVILNLAPVSQISLFGICR